MPASRRKKNGINRNRLLFDNNRHVLDNAGRRAMAPGTVHAAPWRWSPRKAMNRHGARRGCFFPKLEGRPGAAHHGTGQKAQDVFLDRKIASCQSLVISHVAGGQDKADIGVAGHVVPFISGTACFAEERRPGLSTPDGRRIMTGVSTRIGPRGNQTSQPLAACSRG